MLLTPAGDSRRRSRILRQALFQMIGELLHAATISAEGQRRAPRRTCYKIMRMIEGVGRPSPWLAARFPKEASRRGCSRFPMGRPLPSSASCIAWSIAR